MTDPIKMYRKGRTDFSYQFQIEAYQISVLLEKLAIPLFENSIIRFSPLYCKNPKEKV